MRTLDKQHDFSDYIFHIDTCQQTNLDKKERKKKETLTLMISRQQSFLLISYEKTKNDN